MLDVMWAIYLPTNTRLDLLPIESKDYLEVTNASWCECWGDTKPIIGECSDCGCSLEKPVTTRDIMSFLHPDENAKHAFAKYCYLQIAPMDKETGRDARRSPCVSMEDLFCELPITLNNTIESHSPIYTIYLVPFVLDYQDGGEVEFRRIATVREDIEGYEVTIDVSGSERLTDEMRQVVADHKCASALYSDSKKGALALAQNIVNNSGLPLIEQTIVLDRQPMANNVIEDPNSYNICFKQTFSSEVVDELTDIADRGLRHGLVRRIALEVSNTTALEMIDRLLGDGWQANGADRYASYLTAITTLSNILIADLRHYWSNSEVVVQQLERFR